MSLDETEMEAELCDEEAEAELMRHEEEARRAAEAEARAKAEAQAQTKAKAAAARAEAKPPLDAHDALHWSAAKGNATELRHRSTVKVPPLAVPQLGTPRKRPAHWVRSHCLGCSSKPPPKPPIPLPLTIQAESGPLSPAERRRVGRLLRRAHCDDSVAAVAVAEEGDPLMMRGRGGAGIEGAVSS